MEKLLLIFSVCFLLSCNSSNTKVASTNNKDTFIQKLYVAHQKASFLVKGALSFDMSSKAIDLEESFTYSIIASSFYMQNDEKNNIKVRFKNDYIQLIVKNGTGFSSIESPNEKQRLGLQTCFSIIDNLFKPFGLVPSANNIKWTEPINFILNQDSCLSSDQLIFEDNKKVAQVTYLSSIKTGLLRCIMDKQSGEAYAVSLEDYEIINGIPLPATIKIYKTRFPYKELSECLVVTKLSNFKFNKYSENVFNTSKGYTKLYEPNQHNYVLPK
jgi:hypothetical protein